MDAEKIRSELVKLVVDKLKVEESQITPSASFQDDLKADSLDTVDLIMEIEKTFDIEIPDEESANIKTVGEAEALVKAKLGVE